jgi:hypothetical protein
MDNSEYLKNQLKLAIENLECFQKALWAWLKPHDRESSGLILKALEEHANFFKYSSVLFDNKFIDNYYETHGGISFKADNNCFTLSGYEPCSNLYSSVIESINKGKPVVNNENKWNQYLETWEKEHYIAEGF